MMSTPWEFKLAPDPATKEPRSPWAHQLESFEMWKDSEAYGCWWEMGTGKTGEACNLLEYKRAQGAIQRALILATEAVSYGWVEELEGAWGKAPLNLAAMRTSAARQKALAAFTGAYVICNYDGLVGIEETLYVWLGDRHAVVADESTSIKNHRAQRSKALLRLASNAAFKMCMSGTPMPQGPQDAFGQYLLLDHRVFGNSFVTFRNRWMRMGGFGGKEIMGLRPEKRREFNAAVYSIGDRRTKLDCLDMPPKNYQTLHYELSLAQRKVYNDLAREWVAEIRAKTISVTDGMTKALRLAQACTGFIGDREAGETTEHDVPDGGTKIAVLQELLEQLDGKAIIWCAWRRNVREVMALAKRMKLKAVDFYGDTEDKQLSQMAFRNDAATRLFVGTAQSGGPGLNLQGPEVKTVIYFSQNYSVFNRLQSEDRAHRGSIKHTVTVIDICAKNTIEVSITKALRQGRQVQDLLLQNPKAFIEGNIPEEE